MKTIDLLPKDIYKGHLILVNDRHPIVCPIDPSELMMTEDNIMLHRDSSRMLFKIFEHLNCHDDIAYVSGYRSNQEQTELFEQSYEENGEEYTRKFVALPSCSEHETGLAIDLGLKKDNIDFICPDFPYEGICQEFRELAYDYGFIERYLETKEDITHISKEPWHFRYVGYPHSQIMRSKNLSLEEYHDFIKGYSIYQPYQFVENNRLVEIFYVPIKHKESICLRDDVIAKVSGNNIDGVIVTAWRLCV